MKRRNAKRAAAARARDFGPRSRIVAIASMPCVCGGKHPACTGGWSQPSHVVSRGAGGDREAIVPKSDGCHRAWHQHGRETYLAVLGWTMADMLARAVDVSAQAERIDDDLP